MKIEVRLSAEYRFSCQKCGKKNIRSADPEKDVEQISCRFCKEPAVTFNKMFIHEWSCPRCGRSYIDTNIDEPMQAIICTGPKCKERICFHTGGAIWEEVVDEKKKESLLQKIRERLSPLQGGTAIDGKTVIVNPQIERQGR